MASIQARISRGKKYWSIVESHRVNGQPRTRIIEYLGTADTLFERLQRGDEFSITSYSHGDTAAILNIAIELDIISIINKYVPVSIKNNKKPKRDNLTVGASLLLAAIGRACQPTSKKGWYEWCKGTSLGYCLRTSFKKLNSQHFWDQMNTVPLSALTLIEEEVVKKLIDIYEIKMDCLFYDTTNFFTFIDSTNRRCMLPQRGRNKQKRFDLRQIGMALLVTREDQLPIFHNTYEGNKNDVTSFKEVYDDLLSRLKSISKEMSEITIVFDKGNNSKENFKNIDVVTKKLYYVAGLVPAHFKKLIQIANNNFTEEKIDGENISIYRSKSVIWKNIRTCIVIISKRLKDGQIRGIRQALKKRYQLISKFKQQIESPSKKKILTEAEIKSRLLKIIKGQFVGDLINYKLIVLEDNTLSFTYTLNKEAYRYLRQKILGRQIIITNRHEWSNEEIIHAYRGQAKIEYAFRCFKNPFHFAIRPQYHWTDQKIQTHLFICLIGYLLSAVAYRKAKKEGYTKNINSFMEEMKSIRLACCRKRKSNKLKYQLETLPEELTNISRCLSVSNENLHPKVNFSDYKQMTI